MALQVSPLPNVLGTISTVCWCISLLPQIWRNYRSKNTDGLPSLMLILWAASGVPSGIYAIAQNFSVALVVQPHCFTALCGIAWAQCLVYQKNYGRLKIAMLLSTVTIVFAAVEVALIVALQRAHGRLWPVLTVGLVACVLDLAGFIPIPFEILKRRGRVVGIDFVFLGIDWCGFFFSLLALAMQRKFDILFGTTAALCCAIEIGVAISHLTWLFRTRKIRKRAKDAGQTFDEFEDGIRWQAEGVDIQKALLGLLAKKIT